MSRVIRLVEDLANLDDREGLSLTLQVSLLREEARAIVAASSGVDTGAIRAQLRTGAIYITSNDPCFTITSLLDEIDRLRAIKGLDPA